MKNFTYCLNLVGFENDILGPRQQSRTGKSLMIKRTAHDHSGRTIQGEFAP